VLTYSTVIGQLNHYSRHNATRRNVTPDVLQFWHIRLNVGLFNKLAATAKDVMAALRGARGMLRTGCRNAVKMGA